VLADEDKVAAVYESLAKRHPKSRCRGSRGTPAEMVLRLSVLKHIRNWSYEVLEREVRANSVYRDFTRVGGGKMPDAKTMGRWGVALGPEVLKQVHERMVKIALEKGVTTGRRMRMDTTVLETDVHLELRCEDRVAVIDRVLRITDQMGEAELVRLGVCTAPGGDPTATPSAARREKVPRHALAARRRDHMIKGGGAAERPPSRALVASLTIASRARTVAAICSAAPNGLPIRASMLEIAP
jgi:Transposase domain (DUF772)